jgi:co-chaperonin GroES (HSP10)
MPAVKAEYATTGTGNVDLDDFEVFGDIILVIPEREEVSSGGIVIADVGDAQKVRWGVVVKHGDGVDAPRGHDVTMKVAVGDRVMFSAYQSGGEPIRIGGQEFLLFRMGDLVGRLRAA